MSDETVENIIKFVKRNIHKYLGIYISWFGGEPLLELKTIITLSQRIIDICKENRKPYYSDITTNGYLLTRQHVEQLVKCKVREFCITLDGGEKTHNKMRKTISGGETYRTIINNLIAIRNRKEYPIKICIRINLTKENVMDFCDYYAQFDRLFGMDKRFSIYIKIVRDWGGNEIKILEKQLIDDKQLGMIYKKYAEIRGNLRLTGCFDKLQFGGMSCAAMRRNSLVIYANGSFGKCEKDNMNNSIGRITDSGLQYDENKFELWNGIAYKLNKKCDECVFSTLCFGGTCSYDKIIEPSICSEQVKYQVDDLLNLYGYLYNDR